MKQQQQSMNGGATSQVCCVKFMRIILFIANLFVLLLGGAALGIGIWSLNGDYGADNIEVLLDTSLYSAVSYILVIGGAVVIATAILGIAAAVLEKRNMLVIYFIIMTIFCLLFIVGGITTFFFLDEVKSDLSEKMEETLKNRYHVDLGTNSKNNDVTTVWDELQRKLHCCGVRGGLTGTESWFMWQSSQWFEDEGKATLNPANHIYVPTTCCNPDYLHDQCNLLNAEATQPPQKSVAGITAKNPALYDSGCFNALEEKVNDHIVGICVVALFIFILLIVCAVFSLMVAMDAGRIGHVV